MLSTWLYHVYKQLIKVDEYLKYKKLLSSILMNSFMSVKKLAVNIKSLLQTSLHETYKRTSPGGAESISRMTSLKIVG